MNSSGIAEEIRINEDTLEKLARYMENFPGQMSPAVKKLIASHRSLLEENRAIRSELVEKDKVLQEIKRIIWDMDIHPATREARINILIDSILSQYTKET